MMPPINGMHAMAAATLEGKPVDVDFAVVPGSGLGCRRLNGHFVWHDLHTRTGKCIVKHLPYTRFFFTFAPGSRSISWTPCDPDQ